MARFKQILVFLLVLFIINLFSSPSFGAVLVQRVHLKAVGDIMVHDVQYNSVYDWETGNFNFDPMFQPVEKCLEADILIGNLETTLSGPEIGYSSYPRFNSPDSLAQTLRKLGFNILFTANNHSLDKGENGLTRTIEVLKENNIFQTGTFTTREDLDKPCIINAKGISFGFLNYTYGTNGIVPPKGKEYLVNYLELVRIIKEIKVLRPQVDMIVVGLHFGTEYEREPSEEQKVIAQEIARAGADIILGGHPHVLQPFEFMKIDDKKCFIVYSLGNFVSGQKGRYRDSGAILELVVEKTVFEKKPRIVKVDFQPVWVRRYLLDNSLRMEVIPTDEEIVLKKPLSNFEQNKLIEVNGDVREVWSVFTERKNTNEFYKLWANINIPFLKPQLILSILFEAVIK